MDWVTERLRSVAGWRASTWLWAAFNVVVVGLVAWASVDLSNTCTGGGELCDEPRTADGFAIAFLVMFGVLGNIVLALLWSAIRQRRLGKIADAG